MVTMRTRTQLPNIPSIGVAAVTLAGFLCFAGTSHAAEEAGQATGVETHDGFMLRLTLGLGYGSSTEEIPTLGDIELSGASGFFSLDLGGALVDNLVLHGRLSDMVVASPTLSINGSEEFETGDDVSLTFYLLGAGLTYYLMPANVYFTGVVGIAKASADNGSTESSTKAGFGLEGDIGKEWWVSDNWGIGLAGRITFASVPDEVVTNDSTTLQALGFGVLFSATYQ